MSMLLGKEIVSDSIITSYKWRRGSREIIERGWKQRLHGTSDFDTMKR